MEYIFSCSRGKGKGIKPSFPGRNKKVCEFLYENSKESPFHITTTEASFYKVFYVLKEMEKGKRYEEILKETRKMAFGVRDGNGVISVSYKGDIYPAGFLPINLGNVKKDRISEIYRNNQIMRELRDVSLLKGKCGRCEFKNICGGSRAKAFSMKGDCLEEDEFCFLNF